MLDLETRTLSSLFPVPWEPKHDVGMGSRLLCKASTSLEVPQLLSGFTSIRKGPETPSTPSLEPSSSPCLVGHTRKALTQGFVMGAFSITPARVLQSPLLKDVKRCEKNKQKNDTRTIKQKNGSKLLTSQGRSC